MSQILQPSKSTGGSFAGGSVSSSTFSGTVDPTHSLDSSMGVRVGDWYYNTVSGNLFQARSVAVGAAIWAHRPRILGQSAVASTTLTGTTNETIFATIPVPAGAMGVDGALRIFMMFSQTNSANNKTERVRLGGIGGTAFYAVVRSTQALDISQREIANRGAANSQVAFNNQSGGFNNSTGGVTTGAIDTSVAQDLVITGQLANSGESMALESYRVELLRPDIT